MQDSDSSEVTKLLIQWHEGDGKALNKLFDIAQDQLKELARFRLVGERRAYSHDTLGLVSDLYIKLTGEKQPNLKNRSHFFGAAAIMMRNIIIDHARTHRAVKRGQNLQAEEPIEGLDKIIMGRELETEQILATDLALVKLKKIDPEATQLVDMKFFLGLTNMEISHVLGIGERTVRRNLDAAIAWLNRELSRK